MGLLAVRVVLGVVFALAAAGKLADRHGARTTLVDTGIPERWAAPGAVLLPLAELAVAAALLVDSWARPGAAAAVALLAVFSGAVARNLAAGRTLDCHCFGRLHASPIGAATLVRNALLAALGSLVLVGGPGLGLGDSLAQIDGGFPAARLGLVGGTAVVAVAAAVGWFIVVARRQWRLLVRPGGRAPAGAARRRDAAAPAFTLASTSGPPATLEDLTGRGRPVLLVFTAAGCRPCLRLLPEVGRWQRDHADTLTVVVLAQGDVAVNRASAAPAAVSMLFDPDGSVARAYGCDATPGAVLVGADGTVHSLLAAGADQIRVVVSSAVAAHHRQREVRPVSAGADL
ncbi:MAG TPA: TlpA disulfide reductase family protein, partial [Acidimicrobiia bacterium]|nr:TlpA disulfide reductase family protein [Acidimicrobiia bacterium]